MEEASERSLFEHLGQDVLTYVLSVDDEMLRRRLESSTNRLSDEQENVLAQLVAIDDQIGGWRLGQDTADEWARRFGSASDPDPAISLGNLARKLTGGTLLAVPNDADDIEVELFQMAIDTYPGLLVKEPEDPIHRRIGHPVSIFRHPANERFQKLVYKDSDLKKLFDKDSEQSGPGGMVTRSTGQGGSIQLWTFAETVLYSAWTIATLDNLVPMNSQYLKAVRVVLQTIRAAIQGKSVKIPARVGITGVLLPESVDSIDLKWAKIRRSGPQDQAFISSTSLEGQLTGTNELGETAVINYSGDLVLELEVPFALRLGERDVDAYWAPGMMISSNALSHAIENVRLGLLLAFPDRRVVVHSSWIAMLDPFNHGRHAGWSDIKRAVGLMPTQLSTEQVGEWKIWTTRIGKNRIPTIGVAIRRMLAAVGERRTMEDILVDAVIVWENLFGASTETTLRISSSLSWLLGTSRPDRMIRLARYKRIYGFRSKVVHGAPQVDSQKLQEYGFEAVQTSILALRAIFNTHVHLLDIKESEGRSEVIMHQGDERSESSSK